MALINLESGARHSRYSSMESRMRTFEHWPQAMPQTARQLAYAGFFYLGRGDHVQCFFCDGGLKNWDPTDQPWIEHARFFGDCAYLLLKQGREFVQRVRTDQPLTQVMLSNFDEVISPPPTLAVVPQLRQEQVVMLGPHSRPQQGFCFAGEIPCTDGAISAEHCEMARLEEENQRLVSERQCKICMNAESQVSTTNSN